MKFNCGLSPDERSKIRQAKRDAKFAIRRQWKEKFIFWPKRIGDACYALTWVERRRDKFDWSWEYRLIGTPDEPLVETPPGWWEKDPSEWPVELPNSISFTDLASIFRRIYKIERERLDAKSN